MSVRVQVILNEEEAARFKAQAGKESKSLSAWLREAGQKMLEMNLQACIVIPWSPVYEALEAIQVIICAHFSPIEVLIKMVPGIHQLGIQGEQCINILFI